jgi:hypothetical protein
LRKIKSVTTGGLRAKSEPEKKFEVLTAASKKMAVFCVVAPCRLVNVYQRLRGTCCLHLQGDGNSKDRHLPVGERDKLITSIMTVLFNAMLLKLHNESLWEKVTTSWFQLKHARIKTYLRLDRK